MNANKKNNSKSSSPIWIIGAGTGGHITPALCVAEELKKLNPQLEFLFWGTEKRLESKMVPEAGYKINFIQAKAWKGKKFIDKADMLFSLIFSFFEVLKIGLKEKPRAVISIGGYVSAPVIMVAKLFRRKIFLVEPNICAGMANIIFSKISEKAYTTLGSNASQKFKCPTVETGSPIQSSFTPVQIRPSVSHILILGGSQGAEILCRKGLKQFKDLLKWDSSVHLTLQSGERNFDLSQKLQQDLKIENSSSITPFIKNMNEALQVTDLVIARAGALTLAELSTAGLPTILVPYPHAADDHQRKNAQYLKEHNAVQVVDEKDPHFDQKLSAMIRALTVDKDSQTRRLALSKNFRSTARPKAAQIIAKDILSKI